MANNEWASAVRFKEVTMDSKIAPVEFLENRGAHPSPKALGPYACATYLPIKTICPDTCAHKNNGCYAQEDAAISDLVHSLEGNVDKDQLAPRDVDYQHAHAISNSFSGDLGRVPQDGGRPWPDWRKRLTNGERPYRGDRGRDLRLCVSGDVATPEGADMLGKAAHGWRARGGGDVWTYTHRGREVRRKEWGSAISVLASVEDPADIPALRAQGYASAIVWPEQFHGPKRIPLPQFGVNVVPCHFDTLKRTCIECRLCFDDAKLLKDKLAIGFAPHGGGEDKVIGTVSQYHLPLISK